MIEKDNTVSNQQGTQRDIQNVKVHTPIDVTETATSDNKEQ